MEERKKLRDGEKQGKPGGKEKELAGLRLKIKAISQGLLLVVGFHCDVISCELARREAASGGVLQRVRARSV